MRLPWVRIGHDENEPPVERRNRGTVTFKRGGAGVADKLRLLRKNSADTYERADIAVASDLHAAVTVADTASVDLTLTGQQISAAVLPAGVDHNSLNNLTTGDPHTQYLLETGGTITGNLAVDGTVTLGNADGDEHTVNGHLTFNGTLPGFATGNGAGTSGSPTLNAAGSDCSFRVTLTTATSPSAATIFTVTFADAFPSAEYEVVFCAADADAAAAIASVFVDVANQTTTTFTFVARAALAATTSYRWNFHIFGGT